MHILLCINLLKLINILIQRHGARRISSISSNNLEKIKEENYGGYSSSYNIIIIFNNILECIKKFKF